MEVDQALDRRALRDALGHFATGITLVTTRDSAGAPTGLTVNSFASVSLEPPLILWSLSRSAPSFAVFDATDHFAINVLGAEQEGLSARFARGGRKFEGVAWSAGHGGAPLIGGALAHFECRKTSIATGGDHAVIFGAIEKFAFRSGVPLIFYGGKYRHLG